jgi:hypothetical protein
VEEYGFTHEHIAEEIDVTGRGSAQARADFVVWRTPQDKSNEKSPLINGFLTRADIASSLKLFWVYAARGRTIRLSLMPRGEHHQAIEPTVSR